MKLNWCLMSLLFVLVGCSGLPQFGADSSTDGDTSSEQVASSGQLSAPAADQMITSNQIGPAQIGMTLKELKDKLGDRAEFTVEPSFMVDLDAIAIREEDQVLFYVMHFSSEPMTDSDPIQFLLTTHPQFRTQEGVGPGTRIQQAAEVYGQPTLSYNPDNEMRESVRFANFADNNIIFRTNGFYDEGEIPDNFLEGQYGEPVGDFDYETSDYSPDARIRAVMVDGYRVAQNASPTPQPSALPSMIDCDNPRGTDAFNYCAEQDYQDADARLNQMYQRAIATLDRESKAMLVDAQLAWLDFRDTNCEFEASRARGGEGYTAFLNSCLATMTRDRTEQLDLPDADALLQISANGTWDNLGVVTVNGQQINCDNPQSTPEINYCAGLAYERVDTRLNQVYQTVKNQLDASTTDRLIDAQLAWIDFRDTHCEFQVRDARGGTGYSSYLSSCLASVTRDRTQDLEIPDGRMSPF